MRVESDNGTALIDEIESRRGGKITWKSFSIFYADNEGRLIENGVFVYKIDDVFWMEDFEKVPSIFGIRISEPKNYRYEKFERCFKKEDIKSVDTVLKNKAMDFIEHRTSEVRKAGKLAAFFSEPLTMITFKDNSVIFLQLLDASIFKSKA